MKIQITNSHTGGKSEIFDFSELTLKDLEVLLKYGRKLEMTVI